MSTHVIYYSTFVKNADSLDYGLRRDNLKALIDHYDYMWRRYFVGEIRYIWSPSGEYLGYYDDSGFHEIDTHYSITIGIILCK